MESKPLYIIGMGINSAIGLNAEGTCLSLRNSHSGIGRMTLLESAHKDLPVGEVPLSNEALRQRLHIPADEAITRSALLGIMAVREALRSAGVSPKEVPMAFVNGTTVGGMDCSEQYYLDFLNNDSRNEFIALVNEYNAVVYKTEIFLPAYACKHRALLFAYYRNTAGFAVFLICGYHIYQGGLTCCTVATKYRDISYNGKLILYTAAFHHHLIFTFHNDTTL